MREKTRGPHPKSFCKRGHELSGDNVKQLFNKNGTKNGRLCMECNRLNHRRYYNLDAEQRASKVRKYRKENPEAVRNVVLKRKYGITLEQYNTMLTTQQGVCALCGTSEPGRNNKTFSVDHCHSTGKVRKLLCSMCNLALGAAKDNPALLRKMADYIESYQTPGKEEL